MYFKVTLYMYSKVTLYMYSRSHCTCTLRSHCTCTLRWYCTCTLRSHCTCSLWSHWLQVTNFVSLNVSYIITNICTHFTHMYMCIYMYCVTLWAQDYPKLIVDLPLKFDFLLSMNYQHVYIFLMTQPLVTLAVVSNNTIMHYSALYCTILI